MVRNFYATRGLSAVARLLRRERRYLSAADVHALLVSEKVGISLSTVYRTLERLVAQGAASARKREDGEAAYVSCGGEHHHHAICRSCGRVEDVHCEAVDSFAQALRRHHGFELDDHAMEFVGRCRECR